MDQLQELKLLLTFMWTFVQLSYSNLDGFSAKMSSIMQELEYLVESLFYESGYDMLVKYDMDCLVPRLLKNIKSCISTKQHSKSSTTMTEEQLVELLDALLVNLHDLPNCVDDLIPLTQYEVLQNVCAHVREFHWFKVNGLVEHEIVEHVLPQVQLMAERVGHFCLTVLVDPVEENIDDLDETDHSDGTDDSVDTEEFERVFTKLGEGFKIIEASVVDVKLVRLLVKIIPVELEVMRICSTTLKVSESAEVRCFIKQLLEASPDILREYLIHLQEHMINAINTSSSARNIHVIVEFLLIIITDMPKDFMHLEKWFDLLARVGALTREVSVLACHLEEISRNGENTNEINYATLDLLENIDLLKKDLRYVYLKSSNSSQLCFPMSDGLLFMNLLLKNLNVLLNSNAYSVTLIKEEIEMVKENLEIIMSFFLNVEQELYKDHWTRALNAAYEAEHAINSILVRDHGLLQLVFLLPDIIEKIKLIKEEVSNLPKKISKNMGPIVVNSPNKPVGNLSIADQVIIGFEKERDWIIRKLTSGPTEIDVISIIGMPGLGKTTLAHRVYIDKSVVSHFDIRAWCTVDQEHDERKLLHTIFNQVSGSKEKFNKDTDAADNLRKKLFEGRYLIVLDDLWDIATLDELIRCFPEVKGSRIILTSRIKEVALYGKRHSEPLYLRLFILDESWELLKQRIFGEESCPDDLLVVGKEIAQKCQGLPLVADLIAGVIATKEKEKTSWLEVLNNLNSFNFENEVEVHNVIQLSYDYLPDHVKPCLLYLGSYPKDEEIEVSELQDVWSAEGIVEETEMKSVEEVMKVYLNELISSSLVVVRKSDHEYVKATCKIHDLVHDFCQVKATKEKFFDLISSNITSCASDLMPRRMTIPYKHNSSYNPCDLEKKKVSGIYLLSLKVDSAYWETDGFLVDKMVLLLQLRELRLLRVLDLPHILLEDSLLNIIGLLVHLRYLRISISDKALPLSLSNLSNLETLLVENVLSTIFVLLPRIWNLANLRHVNIDGCCFFALDTDEPILLGEDSKLAKLRILEGLKLSYSKDTEDIFKRFPNLQKLDCEIVESQDSSTLWFPKLDVLNDLEELDVFYLLIKN